MLVVLIVVMFVGSFEVDCAFLLELEGFNESREEGSS